MARSAKDRDAIFEQALQDYIKLSKSKGKLVELDWRDVYAWLQHGHEARAAEGSKVLTDPQWRDQRDQHVLGLLQELTAKDYGTCFGSFRFEGWIRWLKNAKTANRKLLARSPSAALFVGGDRKGAPDPAGRFLLRVPAKCPVRGEPTPDRSFPPAPIETEQWTVRHLIEAIDTDAGKKPSKTLATIQAHQRDEGPPLARHDKYSQKVFGKPNASTEALIASNDPKLFVLPSTLDQFAGATSLHIDNTPLLAVPESIGSLSALQTLQVRSTLLTHLPAAIGALSQLTTLDLSGNLALESLPPELVRLDALIQLDLSHCERLQVDVGLLGQLRTLYEINLPPHTTEDEWMDLQDSLPACVIRVHRYDADQGIMVDVADRE
ncbi:MAG TPA: hypothetical protein DFR83_16025 [Deltaproteobacteria bacterium]|nr:hypothetical protein [Deltaproteobacteria bacterium]